MIKKNLLALISLIVIFLGVFLFSRENREVKKSELKTKNNSQNFITEKNSGPALKHFPRKPAQKISDQKSEVVQDKRENFSREKITWIKENLYYVPDLRVHMKRDPLISPLFEGDGFYFYESHLKDGSEVVFNPETKRYGVYTKEITVKGDIKKVSEFASSKNWNINYQNPLLKISIIKVNHLEETSYLTELTNNSSFSWTLGTIYSKPISK